jgi:hypothetical protein
MACRNPAPGFFDPLSPQKFAEFFTKGGRPLDFLRSGAQDMACLIKKNKQKVKCPVVFPLFFFSFLWRDFGILPRAEKD